MPKLIIAVGSVVTMSGILYLMFEPVLGTALKTLMGALK